MFDWRTPHGYMACMILQTLNCYATVCLYACTLTLNMGISMLASDFVLDIEKSLRHLNEDLSKANGRDLQTQLKINEQFVDTIRFHSEAKELSI